MGDLSTHFDRSEFSCKCLCGFDTVDHKLILILEDIRDHFKKPVTINSACRCVAHNATVKGAKKSQHVKGRAADIVVKDVSPREVAEYISNWKGGLKAYNTFTHIDSRDDRARW